VTLELFSQAPITSSKTSLTYPSSDVTPECLNSSLASCGQTCTCCNRDLVGFKG